MEYQGTKYISQEVDPTGKASRKGKKEKREVSLRVHANWMVLGFQGGSYLMFILFLNFCTV
jgi:hypothetical protein